MAKNKAQMDQGGPKTQLNAYTVTIKTYRKTRYLSKKVMFRDLCVMTFTSLTGRIPF